MSKNLLLAAVAFLSFQSLAFAQATPKKLVIYNLSDTPHSFSQFTENTGIEVEVDRGDSIDQIKKDPSNSPHPDLVIVSDAISFGQMKKQGLLAAINSKTIEENISAQFRDLSAGWVGMGFRGRALAYNPKFFTPPAQISYEDLAKPEYQGKLCLRKSTYSYTRALIASLILADGYDAVLETVKGWVSNNPQPIFKGDLYTLRALEKGTCGLAFVNSDYFDKYMSKSLSSLQMVWPNQNGRGVHVNVSGLALMKESTEPELAVQFLEFLAQDQETHLNFSIIKRSFPTNLKFYDQSEPGRRYGRIQWDQSPLSQIIDLDDQAQALSKAAGYLP